MGAQAPVPNVTDERLCWLAVRDHVERKSRKVGLHGWLGALSGGGRCGGAGARASGDMRRDRAKSRTMDYAVAVDAAAGKLNRDERRHLRNTGEVPFWFIDEIDRRVAEMKQ